MFFSTTEDTVPKSYVPQNMVWVFVNSLHKSSVVPPCFIASVPNTPLYVCQLQLFLTLSKISSQCVSWISFFMLIEDDFCFLSGLWSISLGSSILWMEEVIQVHNNLQLMDKLCHLKDVNLILGTRVRCPSPRGRPLFQGNNVCSFQL